MSRYAMIDMTLPEIVGAALTLIQQFEDDTAKDADNYDEILSQYESDAFDLVRRIANSARS